MKGRINRISVFMLFLAFSSSWGAGCTCWGAICLPLNRVFRGQDRFYRLVARAQAEGWRYLPLGDRVVRVGLALCGTPYCHYTLEVDDRIESPSANFEGMDCWTFFEISLAFARMLKLKDHDYRPEDLLHLIELERYRGGHCTGNYLSRIHFLEELFADNQARGLLVNLTPSLGGVPIHRHVREMTAGWRQYRYLRANPSLLPAMAQIEERVSRLPVTYIPKERVREVERELQNGDIIAIVSRDEGGYTSHVGLAYRDASGVLRFMHASSIYGKVVVDRRISGYLNEHPGTAGITVARPKEVPPALFTLSQPGERL
ncbi:N-acetylmuramoyl-L-alanine amidase-like domain-containing protein [Candidatus Methylacidithermus pantelleriae]|nr:N-acetylmuramoyl-L-alanine amidase-like domain-containing protein [Candidatus Methylacidithermus pantelleriae]